MGTKIATCCYCGTRAALVLSGETRHELACSSCGAPLHDLKMLRKDKSGDRELRPRPRACGRKPTGFAPVARISRLTEKAAGRSGAGKKRKRRKSRMSKLFEEAFDVLEDLFD